MKGCDQAADHYLLDVGPGAASVQKRLLRQRVNCCVARAQAGVLLSRLKFALPGWAQAEERRRKEWREQADQRSAQARAYSGEGHSISREANGQCVGLPPATASCQGEWRLSVSSKGC